MSSTPASSLICRVIAAWIGGLALAILLYREGPLLSFDAFHYCEFAKAYRDSWPVAFGNHWPAGFPLLAGFMGWLGVPAYPALCAIAVAAFTALVVLACNALRTEKTALAVALALACVPIVSEQMFAALSELPFAAPWLGLGFALSLWPSRRGLWLAAGCAVLAVCLRYVGLLAIGVLWIWLAWQATELRAAHRLGHAFVAASTATIVVSALLLWNVVATGHLSGAGRGAESLLGWKSLPQHVAHFGWSAPSALMLGGLRDRVGTGSAMGLTLGWLACGTGAAVCALGWVRPAAAWVRPVALITFAYGGGMILLRTIGSFDALYNARTFLPIAFPLGLILSTQGARQAPRLVVAGALLVTAAGVASAVRGHSRAIGGDVRPAVAILRPLLGPNDRIQVNEHAFTVGAYVRQRTPQVWAEYWNDATTERFLVVAARSLDRNGSPDHLEQAWQAIATRLVARGTHRWLLQTDSLFVLECLTPRLVR